MVERGWENRERNGDWKVGWIGCCLMLGAFL